MNKYIYGAALFLITVGVIGCFEDTNESRGESFDMDFSPLSATTVVGDATLLSASTATGRVDVIYGGAATDTFVLYGALKRDADGIKLIDCSNGTGDNCVLVFDK